jgi:fucose 4-O-acetylase-like acetyltransferase
MEWLNQITAWIGEHSVTVVTVATAILEVVFRLWKSDKIRSIFSYLGKLLHAIANFIWLISDILSKVVPDRRAETPAATPPK